MPATNGVVSQNHISETEARSQRDTLLVAAERLIASYEISDEEGGVEQTAQAISGLQDAVSACRGS